MAAAGSVSQLEVEVIKFFLDTAAAARTHGQAPLFGLGFQKQVKKDVRKMLQIIYMLLQPLL